MNRQIYHIDDCEFMLELTSMNLEHPNLVSINPLKPRIKTPLELMMKYPKIFNADLIITDYSMGVFTGLELVSYLRENNYKNEIYCFSGEEFNAEISTKLTSLEVIIINKEKPLELKNKIYSNFN